MPSWRSLCSRDGLGCVQCLRRDSQWLQTDLDPACHVLQALVAEGLLDRRFDGWLAGIVIGLGIGFSRLACDVTYPLPAGWSLRASTG